MKKLDKKVVFITGGLSGIGLACAIASGEEGALVAIADLDKNDKDTSMNEIRKTCKDAIFTACDVSDFYAVEKVVAHVINVFGRIDVALNNAGIGGHASKMGDMSEHDWLEVVNVNFNGVFNCMKHELKQMSQQKSGVIVNMSSILGVVGFASSSHYSAAKHGVIGMTQTAALEYATEGIRVNAICPGFIETPLLEKGGITGQQEVLDHIVGLHPMKRLGMPEEIARGFVFLASDDSSFMTGTCVEMDGGFLSW